MISKVETNSHLHNFSLKQPWLVQAGLSLNQSSVQDIKMSGRYRSGSGAGVRCIISLANWSMFTLLDVETINECGTTNQEFPPRNVFPGYRYKTVSFLQIFYVNLVDQLCFLNSFKRWHSISEFVFPIIVIYFATRISICCWIEARNSRGMSM